MLHLFRAALAVAALSLPFAALAQPDSAADRPVRLVVPLSAGGPSDFMARQIAQGLAASLGHAVVVENKPGASGLIAAREVAASPQDGLTLLYAPGSMVAAPLLTKSAPFDWQQQLAPLGIVGSLPFGLAVNKDVPAASVADLVKYAQARPGVLNVASSTPSEVLAATQFMKATGVTMTRIPYRGAQQAMPDLLSGRVQVMFGPLAALEGHVKSGAVRLLAVLGAKRVSQLPDVPTLKEAGISGVQVPTWQGLYAPAKLTPTRLHQLAEAVASAAAAPGRKPELEKRLLEVEWSAPAEQAQTIARELPMWAALVSEHNLAGD